ncbi:MAG: hypothetical protein KAT37_00595 [Candidatus Aenigmarchaeota archaeon]|nr:hypothetical protein [Candidatus Aenigmarchaeota archaeon]
MPEAKKSIFIETFGNSPLIKTMDFFLTFQEFDYSKTQVSDETGVSRITMDKIWKKLKEKKIIVKTREIGRAEMYKLNTNNPRVKILIDLDFKLSSAYVEKEVVTLKA